MTAVVGLNGQINVKAASPRPFPGDMTRICNLLGIFTILFVM